MSIVNASGAIAAGYAVTTVTPATLDFPLLRTQKEWIEGETPNGIKEAQKHSLRAVQNHKVAVMDGNRFINRPSPGVVGSAQMIHDVLWTGAPARGPAHWQWLHDTA